MAKSRKIPHFTIDDKNQVVIIHSAKNLTDEEHAQIKMMKELLNFSIRFEKAFTEEQLEVHEKASQKNSDYYLGNKEKGIEPQIISQADRDVFNEIKKHPSRDGGGFFKAKAWWENRDKLSQECGVETWDKASSAQKKKIVAYVYTVNIKKGEIIKKGK